MVAFLPYKRQVGTHKSIKYGSRFYLPEETLTVSDVKTHPWKFA